MPDSAASGGLAGLLERPARRKQSPKKFTIICDICGEPLHTNFSKQKRHPDCVEEHHRRYQRVDFRRAVNSEQG